METPKVRLLGVGTTRSSESFIKSVRRLRGLNWLRKLLMLPQVPLLIPLNPWIRRRLLEALRSELSNSLGSCSLIWQGLFLCDPQVLVRVRFGLAEGVKAGWLYLYPPLEASPLPAFFYSYDMRSLLIVCRPSKCFVVFIFPFLEHIHLRPL